MLSLFDCTSFIGRSAGGQWRANRTVTADDLLAEMDRVGVDAAVVHHVLAREYSPQVGNARLLEELPANPRLIPCWVLLPHHTGEFAEPDVVVAQMRAAGVAMARLHPATDPKGHRYSIAEWLVGPLLDALAAAGMPVALDFNLFRRAEPPWQMLHELLAAHPELDVILIEVQGRNNRTLYPLLERHPNLYVQSAGLNVHRGIEDFVRRFGAERMVFGSDYPVRSLGAARFHLETADIADADKHRIGTTNLEGLLKRPLTDQGALAHG